MPQGLKKITKRTPLRLPQEGTGREEIVAGFNKSGRPFPGSASVSLAKRPGKAPFEFTRAVIPCPASETLALPGKGRQQPRIV